MLNIPEEIKQLIKSDSIRKNVRIIFLDQDWDDITNKNLIKESVSFTESLCSQNTLKFGLCESSVIEFQTFDVGNIKGERIFVQLEVDVTSLGGGFGERKADLDFPVYVIPYGEFFVDSCERDASNFQMRKVVAYSREYNFEITSLELSKQRTATTSSSDYRVRFPEFVLSHYNILKDEEMKLTEVAWGNKDYGSSSSINGQKGRYRIGRVTIKNYVLLWASEKNTEASSYWMGHNTDYTSLFKIGGEVDYAAIDEFADKLKRYGIDIYKLRYGYANDNSLAYDKFFMPQVGITVPNTDGTYSGYYCTNTPKMDRNNGYVSLLYPYIDDFYTQTKTRFTLYVPHTVTVTIVDSTAGGATVDTVVCKFAPDLKLYKVTVNSPIMDIDTYLSIPRVKYYSEMIGAYRYMVENPQGLNREMIEAAFELMGAFGKFDRTSSEAYKRIDIGEKMNLYPEDKLFPSTELVPKGMDAQNCEIISRGNYMKAWYDDVPTKRYGAIYCKYKTSAGEEKEYTYNIIDFNLKDSAGAYVYNPDDYQTYDLSENYVIKNSVFTETALAKLLESLGKKIKDIVYMPADVQCVGLPYLEPGDVLEVLTDDGGFDTLVLRRTIKGIQALEDTIESKG